MSQLPAPDADGEAFRTAARLGPTLRFLCGCAIPGMPGSRIAYEAATKNDRAAAMREAVERAASAMGAEDVERVRSGGEAGEYPPLPIQVGCIGIWPTYSADQMRAYVDADRAARAQAPAAVAESTEECAEIIQSLITNIQAHGLYTQESTLGFLEQAYFCLKPANTPATTKASPADALDTETIQKAKRYDWLRDIGHPASDLMLAAHFHCGRGEDFGARIDREIVRSELAAMAAQQYGGV